MPTWVFRGDERRGCDAAIRWRRCGPTPTPHRSQFNCLEFVGPNVVPEDGVTGYARGGRAASFGPGSVTSFKRTPPPFQRCKNHRKQSPSRRALGRAPRPSAREEAARDGLGRVAATPRLPRGESVMSRRHRGHRRGRGDAAAATRRVRDVAATPRPPRGESVMSRRRRGRHAVSP